MDVHELEQALQEVLSASISTSDNFETAWGAFQDFTSSELEDHPGLIAEAVFADDGLLNALRHCFERHRKQAASTRQRILNWLLGLLPRLEAAQLVQHVPVLLQAAMYHTKNEETSTPRIYALELLAFIFSLMLDGQLSSDQLPESPLALAAPLQRIFMSSEARKTKSLRAALLGALGLLLQLSNAAGTQSVRAAPSRVQGVEPLTRHWLLEMCRGELAGPDGKLSATEANHGAIQGMTAALELMQPGEADADLRDMLYVVVHLVQEVTATSRPGARSPTSYGKYKTALTFVHKLGPRLVAARLLTRPTPTDASLQQPPVVAAVLLECLLEVSANSINRDMRAAAEAAMTETASLVCQELLEVRSPDGAAVLNSLVGSCSAHLAGLTTMAAAAATAQVATGVEAGVSGGWLRGAAEVLGKLCPAVATYQGPQVLTGEVVSLAGFHSSQDVAASKRCLDEVQQLAQVPQCIYNPQPRLRGSSWARTWTTDMCVSMLRRAQQFAVAAPQSCWHGVVLTCLRGATTTTTGKGAADAAGTALRSASSLFTNMTILSMWQPS